MSKKLPLGMRPTPEPTPYACGYTLDLYCDHLNDAHRYTPMWPGYVQTIFGDSFVDCSARASRAGWRIHRGRRTATCPMCVRALNQP